METGKIAIIIIITILVLIIVISSNEGMVSQSLKGTDEEFDYGTCKCVNGELLSNNCKYPFQHPSCPSSHMVNLCYCGATPKDFESQDCDSLTNPAAKFLCEKKDKPRDFLFFGCGNKDYHGCLDDGRMMSDNSWVIYNPELGRYCFPSPYDEEDNPNCPRASLRIGDKSYP